MTKRRLSTAILDHAVSREVFKSEATGFAVNAYTGYTNGEARYSQINEAYTHDGWQGRPYVSHKGDFCPSYVVRVWPKHNDTRFRVPPPYKPGDPPGTYTRRITAEDIEAEVRQLARDNYLRTGASDK